MCACTTDILTSVYSMQGSVKALCSDMYSCSSTLLVYTLYNYLFAIAYQPKFFYRQIAGYMRGVRDPRVVSDERGSWANKIVASP